jgi:hypothetical protein
MDETIKQPSQESDMSASGPALLVVAESLEELECLTDEAAVTVEFDSKAAEQAYQKRDWRLHLQICDVMGMTAGADRSDGLVHMIEDWWPNKSRHMEIDTAALGPDQVESLRLLLKGEFEDWVIHVGVYRGFTSEASRDKPEFIGGLSIYATRIHLQRTVLHACGLEPLLRISGRA